MLSNQTISLTDNWMLPPTPLLSLSSNFLYLLFFWIHLLSRFYLLFHLLFYRFFYNLSIIHWITDLPIVPLLLYPPISLFHLFILLDTFPLFTLIHIYIFPLFQFLLQLSYDLLFGFFFLGIFLFYCWIYINRDNHHVEILLEIIYGDFLVMLGVGFWFGIIIG